jgi:hypothetical protein
MIMSTLLKSPPKPKTAAPAAPPEFPPSEELGHQLQHLAELQAEVDRKKAEELARLREIQDRD